MKKQHSGVFESAQNHPQYSKDCIDSLPSRWDKLPRYEGECVTYLVEVERGRIGVVNAILESIDDLARVQTKEMGTGILEIVVPGDYDEVFHSAMGQLAKQVPMRFLNGDQTNL